MSKKNNDIQFVCNNCGDTFTKWQGRCPSCQEFNTIQEFKTPKNSSGKAISSSKHKPGWTGMAQNDVKKLSDVGQGEKVVRLDTGLTELNRVLGGGLVPDSIILLGGEPGIGKSTLLIQALATMSQQPTSVLYVSGEESLQQIASRAQRLGLPTNQVNAVGETEVESIVALVHQTRPKVVVVDSIQTLQSAGIDSAPGSVSQVRECAAQLTSLAKTQGCAIFLVGHVTKSGDVAGPRVLEHMVDTVLYFEGDSGSPFRLIRAMKNRFGAVNEIGAFEMTSEGLISVDNPSAMFLSVDKQPGVGGCVFVLQEGPRALLVEIQALVDDAIGNNPIRLPVGIDKNRLTMLLGVLHKHAQLEVAGMDVFVNAVGGLKTHEPAADLAITMAILSSLRGKASPPGFACFGEIGLTGEIRPVQFAEDRIREAAKLGFTHIMVPQRNLTRTVQLPPDVNVIGVKTLGQAISQMSNLY